MGQTVFYSELDEFCRKFLVAVPGQPAPQLEDFQKAWVEQEKALFENLMLFEQICFKVKGESILIGVLHRMLGERGFNALLEQKAIKFVLWDQDVMFFHDNIPNLNALCSGKLTASVQSDPFASLEQGFKWWANAPTGPKRKRLIQKLAKLYEKPEARLTEKAVSVAQTAAVAGRLAHYGITTSSPNLDLLTTQQKITLSRCAQDYAEHGYLIKEDMTSFSEYKYFSPFWDTAQRFQQATRTVQGFAEIAEMEGLPNLRLLHGEIDKPMDRLAHMRQTHNAITFRNWLSETAGEGPDKSLTKSYIDEIQYRKGLLESATAKVLTKVVLATFGIGIGATLSPEVSPLLTAVSATLGGAVGLAGSSVVSSAMEKLPDLASDVGVELFDSFLIERVTKGWIPRMFVTDLERLRLRQHKEG